jgi:hypothetical protein
LSLVPLARLDAVSYSPPPAGPQRAPRLSRSYFSRHERIALVLVGSVVLGLLLTAARLTPDPRGLGTHRQLGLPPCTVVTWLGIRCPSCGMTTAWSHFVRGNVVAAVRANAGGALLALTAGLCGPWLLASGAMGRWLIVVPQERAILACGVGLVGVVLIHWTMRLSFGW